jgi:hypothetical protein
MPMDHLKINKLRESDFDSILADAGGRRAAVDDSRCSEPNADYILNEAVVELKLVEEEGIAKQSRQHKIAELFRRRQPTRPVIVLDPDALDERERRIYYNVMEGPIKTLVRKAARQLHTTQQHHPAAPRVLLAVNNGYTALDMREFESVVVKCARNETSKIDYVIAAGIYYYSDMFDSFLFAPFGLTTINSTAASFTSFEALRKAWNDHVERYMKSIICGQTQQPDDRPPVVDFVYDLDGIAYVKPAPPMGRQSEWLDGKRPRGNSTGLERCPPVARTFPGLDQTTWAEFKRLWPEEDLMQESYTAWCAWAEHEDRRLEQPLHPFVKVPADIQGFHDWCDARHCPPNFHLLCSYASELFQQLVISVVKRARARDTFAIALPHYIYLRTEEIGQDKAHDVSSIYYVSSVAGMEAERPLVENQRIFFEYALAVAAAYAIKLCGDFVVYEKDLTYAWI